MTCKNCVYCWKAEDDDFACCHYEKIANWDLAPCEQDCDDTEDLRGEDYYADMGE